MELIKTESSPIVEVEVNPIKVEVISEKLKSKLPKEKLEKLFTLTIEAVMPKYLIRDLELFLTDTLDCAGYHNLYSNNDRLKDQVVINIEPYFIEEFIEKGFNKIFFEVKEIGKYLQDYTFEESVDLIFNSLSESAIKDIFKNMFNQNEITTLYHELMHGFITRIYTNRGSEYSIEESIKLLEDLTGKLDSKIDLKGEATYSQIINQNHIEVVKLIHTEFPPSERFKKFYEFYLSGLSELWVRLEEIRLIKTFKGALHEDIEDYSRLGIYVVNFLIRSYYNHTYLPPFELLGDLIVQYNGDTITSDQITDFIKSRILPLLDEKVICREWVRINELLG